MAEPTTKLDGVQGRVDWGLAPDRIERLRAGYIKRLAQRRLARRAAFGVGGVLMVVTLGFGLRALVAEGGRLRTAERAEVSSRAPLMLVDGSRVAKLDALSIVRVQEATTHRAVVEVVRGGARFDVTHRAGRPFRVLAGPVTVDVVGTEFTVERIEPRVRVAVLRGRVRVTSEGQAAYVSEGETGVFPRVQSEPAPSALASPVVAKAQPAVAAEAQSGATPAWRQLAGERKFAEARSVLELRAWAVPSNAADLLLAADVARQAGVPAKAMPLLRRFIQEFPSDPRASAAAFTLGKTLMAAGSARDAARAFARAGQLDNGGAISEDALAREVEALAEAGDAEHAKRRAQTYLERYPSGLRLDAVRRHGGL